MSDYVTPARLLGYQMGACDEPRPWVTNLFNWLGRFFRCSIEDPDTPSTDTASSHDSEAIRSLKAAMERLKSPEQPTFRTPLLSVVPYFSYSVKTVSDDFSDGLLTPDGDEDWEWLPPLTRQLPGRE
jgi:hypothetical protein